MVLPPPLSTPPSEPGWLLGSVPSSGGDVGADSISPSAAATDSVTAGPGAACGSGTGALLATGRGGGAAAACATGVRGGADEDAGRQAAGDTGCLDQPGDASAPFGGGRRGMPGRGATPLILISAAPPPEPVVPNDGGGLAGGMGDGSPCCGSRGGG